MNNVYKISYIKWHGDTLYVGGEGDTYTKTVVAETHGEAVFKLRTSLAKEAEAIEVTGISLAAVLDIG